MIKQHQAIASARAYLTDAKFDNIVSMLNLECIGDWHHWKDSDDNILTITKKRSAIIYPAKERSFSTKDLFRKASPETIAKHSYWVIYIERQDKKTLSFLGNDGILRSSLFENNWICNFSSMLLGFQILKYISNYYLEDECIEVKQIKQPDIKQIWGTPFPSNNERIQEKICHLIAQNLKEL